MVSRKRQRFDKAAGGLRPATLKREVQQKRAEVDRLGARLRPAMDRRMKRLREYYVAQARVLDSVSYERVLARGFALVTRADGALVRSAAAVAEGDALRLRFSDGEAAATAGTVTGGATPGGGKPRGAKPAPVVEAPAEPPPRPRIRRARRESDTGDLF
jgi:exodeoxyribonuclease VII large subunit